MKVVVVGSGAREHALARRLSLDAEVIVTPGNAGMMLDPQITVSKEDPDSLVADLVVIGPEVPLVEGMADHLRALGIPVFGPGADGAQLEGSKEFMKQVLVDAGVPTAAYGAFTELAPALDFLDHMGDLFVVKTDGLAAGKGVLVTTDRGEAAADIAEKLSGSSFGDAGSTVVIEEGLSGPECSLLAIVDGKRALALAPAQDFKRALDKDLGPNTGGMGAYSPMPSVSDSLVEELMAIGVDPTVAQLRSMGIDYRGVLYAGLMLTPTGPKILEYNVRFGDPEAEVVLPRVRGNFAELLLEAALGDLQSTPIFEDDATVCVVMASEHYPEAPMTGRLISGLGADGQLETPIEGVTVFHAGTVLEGEQLYTSGGRVLTLSAQRSSIAEAREAAYAAVQAIHFEGAHYRSDIALEASKEKMQ
ncbi:MAG: phosphoribosylamine--glycine ligase [Actinomycetota bacterium]